MKKIMIAASVLLILLAFVSCNNDNKSLDDEVATTVAEELKPRELVEKVLRDGDKEGVDISYDLREVEKGAKPSYTHTLSVTVVFSGYEYSRVLTIESGRLTYIFYGTMSGSRFTSRAYELRTEEAMAVSGTSEGTVDVELSIDAREGASGTSYGVTLTTNEEGKTVAEGTPSVSVTIPDDAVLSGGGTETKIPEEDPPYIPSEPTSVTVSSSDTPDSSWYDATASTLYIRDAGDLLALVETVNGGESLSGKTLEFESDFDISAIPWTPIGEGYRKETGATFFSGTIDGKGHTITGLNNDGYTIEATDTDGTYAYGFIALAEDATVKNLNFSAADIDVADGDSVGILVGFVKGSLSIENVTIDASSKVSAKEATAAIIGRAYADGTEKSLLITGVTNNASVSGTDNKTGGIVAIISSNNDPYQDVTLRNVTNKGSVTGVNDGVGGIIGYIGNPAKVTLDTVVNGGDVHSTGKWAGGIIGYFIGGEKTVILNGNENQGDVSAVDTNGGLLGYVGPGAVIEISASLNTGSIGNEDVLNSGGLVGGSNSESMRIVSSDNSGSVSAHDIAGGIIGVAGTNDLYIESCSSTGVLTTVNTAVIENQSVQEGQILGAIVGQMRETDATLKDVSDYGEYELIANIYSNGSDIVTLDGCTAQNEMGWSSNAYTLYLELMNSDLAGIEWMRTTLCIKGDGASTIGKINGNGGTVKYTGLKEAPGIIGTNVLLDDSMADSDIWNS